MITAIDILAEIGSTALNTLAVALWFGVLTLFAVQKYAPGFCP